jgi:archaellum component FlaC
MSEAELKHLITEMRISLENRFDRLENRVEGAEKRSDGFENRFDRLENRIDELGNRFDSFGAEMRLHFDIVVMENFEQLTRLIEGVKQNADQGIEETREMIKFSHGQLDQ